MKKLIWADTTEDIDLGDGDFVTIPSNVTVRDMAAVGATGGDSRMEVTLALLQTLIRDWHGPSFTDEDGNPIPCTPENIGKLHFSAASEIAGKLTSKLIGEQITDDVKKESTESSSNT